MSTDPLRPIERLDHGPMSVPEAGGEGNTEFRRLLETLEQISKTARPPDPDAQNHDVQSFAQAVAKADDEFSTVMDMRRRREEAFRSRLP